MGTFLTDEQIARVREELTVFYALPYAIDLSGTAWEQILADAKGGVWTGLRDNRARPDFTVHDGTEQIRYAVKTEGLRVTSARTHAATYLGRYEDFIVARPKVDDLLQPDEAISSLDVNSLGAKVLEHYNDQIVQKHRWDVISLLLRISRADGSREFIYWEEHPPIWYDPANYWWQESGKASGGNRNINGYLRSVDPLAQPLPRAKFKWTSGGKQFYILYEIPRNADIWSIYPVELTLDEIRNALARLIRAKKRILGQPDAT